MHHLGRLPVHAPHPLSLMNRLVMNLAEPAPA
jgi:hypothetical protein